MPVLALFLVFAAGAAIAAQAPTNAALAKASGSVTLAALVSFLVGSVALAAVWATVDRTPPATLRNAPGWAWIGGLYGAAFVAAIAFATPRLGLATAVTVAIAGQLIAALVLDHFGLLGLKVEPVTWTKALGAVVVLAGVVLVRRG